MMSTAAFGWQPAPNWAHVFYDYKRWAENYCCNDVLLTKSSGKKPDIKHCVTNIHTLAPGGWGWVLV